MSRFSAIFLDASGTILHAAAPIAATYARAATDYGGTLSTAEVRDRFPVAMRAARARRAPLGDWRPFWSEVIALSTGVSDPELVDTLYDHFAQPTAWRLAPDLQDLLATARAEGLRIGLISNWDTRLRSLLNAMGIVHHFERISVSGELGVEKPDPAIFLESCAALGVAPATAVHVGDSWAEDVQGARAAGLHAWHLHPTDLPTLAAVATRIRGDHPQVTG